MIDNDVRATPFDVTVTAADESVSVEVPAHYGYLFVSPPIDRA
jgi:hypothetical protein